MKRLIVSGLLAIAAGLVFLYVVQPTDALGDEKPSFWYPSDPELPLVTVSFRGRMLKILITYTLFADGTLRVEQRDPDPAGEVFATHVYQTSQEEVTSALQTAIDGRLLKLSRSEVARLKQYERTYTSDASTVDIRIHIPNLRAKGADQDVPVDTHLILERGLSTADTLTDIPAIVAARDLTTLLQNVERIGKEHNP